MIKNGKSFDIGLSSFTHISANGVNGQKGSLVSQYVSQSLTGFAILTNSIAALTYK